MPNSTVCISSLFITCWLMGSPASYASSVYKSKDESGKIIYSDQPSEHSRPIHIAPSHSPTQEPSSKLDAAPSPNLQPKADQPQNQPLPEIKQYNVVITTPKAETVFTHEIEAIPVKLFLEPDLHPDDRIQVKANDKNLGGFFESKEFKLPPLGRGQYDIQVFVVNKSGKGKPKGKSERIRIYQIRNMVRS